MKLGERMLRVDDGMRGVVSQNGPELRIVYTDRGEERLAAKSEKWQVEDPEPVPLRPEEIAAIAWYADRALKAYERHEPFKFWETPSIDDLPYDAGLMSVVTAYLSARRASLAG